MRVPAGQSARMYDAYEVSVAAIPTRKCDNTIRDCNHRTACGRRVIRGEVRALSSQDRMHASRGKAGTDAWRELQRRSEHGALQRNAFLVVVGIQIGRAHV